jgi:hypothetical protein
MTDNTPFIAAEERVEQPSWAAGLQGNFSMDTVPQLCVTSQCGDKNYT